MPRVDEEGADSGGLSAWVELVGVTSAEFVAANERGAVAPTATANDVTLMLRDEVRAVSNQLRIGTTLSRVVTSAL